MQRDSFIFYRSFFDAIDAISKKISSKDKVLLYESLIKTSLKLDENLEETKRKLSKNPIVFSLFLSFLPQILANNKKFENGCKGREYGVLGKDYGKLGGRPNNPPNNPPNDNDKCIMNNVNDIISFSNEKDNITHLQKNQNFENSEKENSEKKEISKRNVFRPPTIDEVKAYCSKRNNSVDADKWHDFYASKGWMVGKNRMQDWKACVRTWENSQNYQSNQKQKTKDVNDLWKN